MPREKAQSTGDVAMENISDAELAGELARRLKEKDKANHALKTLTRKLETLNKKLMESEAVKSSFLSNIRNEISNPLTSVLTMCELMAESGESIDPEALRGAIDTIHREAFSLGFQLRNIFAAAELEAGESPVTVSRTNLESLVKDTVESFSHTTREKDIDLKVKAGENVTADPLFATDPGKVQLAVANLLANALEYSTEGKSVEVEYEKNDAGLVVTITDEGVGIDETQREAIFERFKQVETGSTKSHGGHGLGLSITRSVVELLGGTIKVESARGEGSVFTISVPAMVAREESSLNEDGTDFFTEQSGDVEMF